MEMDQRGLFGIYGQWHVPFWQTKLFIGAIISLVTLMMLVLAVFAIRWYLKKRRIARETPWDYALAKVAGLEMHPCVTKQDGKQLYGTLSYEMKQYVYKRYGYDVKWKTDEELISFLERHEFPEHLLADLREIMMGSSLVKFANIDVIQETTKRHLALTRTFIKKTVPQSSNCL